MFIQDRSEEDFPQQITCEKSAVEYSSSKINKIEYILFTCCAKKNPPKVCNSLTCVRILNPQHVNLCILNLADLL